MKNCGQCGKPFEAHGCGPTHAAINAGIDATITALYAFHRVRHRYDPDDVAVYEAASLMAAGRRAKFIITLREGEIIDVKAEDGGPR